LAQSSPRRNPNRLKKSPLFSSAARAFDSPNQRHFAFFSCARWS
jgi:hypothetical protein